MPPIKITTVKGSFLFVPVPEGTKSWQLHSSFKTEGLSLYHSTLTFRYDPGDHQGFEHLDNVSIQNASCVGLLSQITEEQAAGIVDPEYHPKTENPDGPDVLVKSAKEVLLEGLKADKVYKENPYLHKGTEKPTGPVEVSYDNGKTFDDSVEWLDKRTCMLAGTSGGNGYFGEGWATSRSSKTDTGLICDPPDFWVYTDEFMDYETAQLTTSKEWLVIKIEE